MIMQTQTHTSSTAKTYSPKNSTKFTPGTSSDVTTPTTPSISRALEKSTDLRRKSIRDFAQQTERLHNTISAGKSRARQWENR